MIRILLVLLIIGGCCNLPLVDCVEQYYYISQEMNCENKGSFCDSVDDINVKVTPSFGRVRLSEDGSGAYQTELKISIENQKSAEIIVNKNNLNVYCLIDEDTIYAELGTFQYIIGSTKKEITLIPEFIVDKKYKGFLWKHWLGVELRLTDSIEIRSIFEVERK